MQKNMRHIEVNTATIVNIEKDYRNHVNRLVKIADNTKFLSSQQKIINQHDVRSQRSQDIHRRKQVKQMTEIQKDNERLLGNLIKINSNSVRESPIKKEYFNFAETSRFNLEYGKVKSLNSTMRKKEIMKVLNDNVQISKKICSQPATLSKQKFDLEFKKNQEYSQRIRKVRVNNKTLELGSGNVKLSPSLRVKNNFPCLPPLPPLSLAHVYPSWTLKSSSAEKRNYKTWALTSRSSSNSPKKDFYKTARLTDVNKPLFNSQGPTPRDSNEPIQILNQEVEVVQIASKEEDVCIEPKQESQNNEQTVCDEPKENPSNNEETPDNQIFEFTETMTRNESNKDQIQSMLVEPVVKELEEQTPPSSVEANNKEDANLINEVAPEQEESKRELVFEKSENEESLKL